MNNRRQISYLLSGITRTLKRQWLTSQKFATILLEKVATRHQRAAVTVATVIAPIANLTWSKTSPSAVILVGENDVLTFVPCRARGLFSVDPNLTEMFRFQEVVMTVFAFTTMLTRRQVEESARRRLV